MAKRFSKNMSDTEKEIYKELDRHYQDWTNDNDIRRTRVNGWEDVTDAYWGELPENWPYDSRVVDPRIRTTIIDKDARLINNKLRGKLVPREGGDVLSARFNNAILDFQWDSANHGGSMKSKLLISSQDARLYGSKFGLVKWMIEKDGDKVTFEGNEFQPLDIRDCGIDPASTGIKDAKWFQHREWVAIEDLEKFNQTASKKAKFKNLDLLKGSIAENPIGASSGGDKRSTRYLSRVKQLKGLQDRMGMDPAFPVVEMVTEYRKDKWISFTPSHGIIHREIDNPYEHRKIPIVQLRYYPLQDDPIGESEIEPVVPLWRAIQALLCGYLDEQNIKMRPPLKVVANQARVETIMWGPEAMWIVDRQDAIEEMRSDSSTTLNYFQTTYQSLVSAFNTAMGDLSQGTSSIDPFSTDRTATEVKAFQRQQNVRDQRNQLDLAEFITDIMMMWLKNNQQFLFGDTDKEDYILKIVGDENFEYFKRAGLDGMEVPDEAMQTIQEIITMQEGNVSDADIEQMMESAKVPKRPVETKDGIVPKMKIGEQGDEAEIVLTPEDIQGTFDYVPDVKSMAAGHDVEMQNGRMKAIDLLINNQNVMLQLQQEGVKVNVKDLLSSTLEDMGLKDANRFFETIQPQASAGQAGSSAQNLQIGGLPTGGAPNPQAGGVQQPMAQPPGPQVQNQGRLSQGLPI